MYGSTIKDPVVKYYDISFALGSPDEIPWYVRKAKQCGSPVLDIACGTGRLSLEFARNGLEVVSIDNSDAMLEQFRQKLSAESALVKNRITIERQSMNSFSFNKSFQTIVCCDAFFHNLTPDDERACLKAVHKHLRPEGRFLFNIHNNPNPQFLNWASSPEAATLHKRADYPIPGTGNVLHIQEGIVHDVQNQMIETMLHFEVTDQKGNMIEESDSNWKSRYLCKYETIYLLELCSLSIESIVGGYLDEPVSTTGQLIFTAKRLQ
jgi:2-polyprenyl-3-methyl-5-hydroxy-6-metoxy-1,4-benzoquinol methylase